jgi:hypothetical protein
LDDVGDYLQNRGAEFGATTGRKRRCGWLDLVMVKDSVRLNGLTSLVITKLDVLTGLEKVKICVAYELEGKRIETTPASLKNLSRCKPVYEEYAGWNEEISSARTLKELPSSARKYLERIEELAQVSLSIISVGSGREQSIILKDPFKKAQGQGSRLEEKMGIDLPLEPWAVCRFGISCSGIIRTSTGIRSLPTHEKQYDVIVVGAGHAGCEAALTAARMGHPTLLLTINLDHIAP